MCTHLRKVGAHSGQHSRTPSNVCSPRSMPGFPMPGLPPESVIRNTSHLTKGKIAQRSSLHRHDERSCCLSAGPFYFEPSRLMGFSRFFLPRIPTINWIALLVPPRSLLFFQNRGWAFHSPLLSIEKILDTMFSIEKIIDLLSYQRKKDQRRARGIMFSIERILDLSSYQGKKRPKKSTWPSRSLE